MNRHLLLVTTALISSLTVPAKADPQKLSHDGVATKIMSHLGGEDKESVTEVNKDFFHMDGEDISVDMSKQTPKDREALESSLQKASSGGFHHITAADFRSLEPYLGKIHSLEIFRGGVGIAEAIAQSPHAKNLTALSIGETDIDVAGAAAIAKNLTSLKFLLIHKGNIGNAAAKALAQNLKNVTHLDLSDNEIGDEGAKALAQSPHLTKLTELHLNHNHIGDEGAKALAQSPHLTKLTELHLNHNHIGDEGAKALAQNLKNVTHLDLSDNNIGNEGANALSLSYSKLYGNRLDVTHYGSRNMVDLRNNPIKNAIKKGIQERFRGKQTLFQF